MQHQTLQAPGIRETGNMLETKLLFTCVHWKNFVVIEHFGDIFLILSKNIIVECSGCQGQFFRLKLQSIHNLWVAVALINSTVSTQEVKILSAFNIPDINTWENSGKVNSQNKRHETTVNSTGYKLQHSLLLYRIVFMLFHRT